VRLDCQHNIVKFEFCTQIIRLFGLQQGSCLQYCVRHTLLRMRLNMCVVCYALLLLLLCLCFVFSFYPMYVCALFVTGHQAVHVGVNKIDLK